MYEHVKTGCKHIPPGEQPLQFQSGYYLNKPRITSNKTIVVLLTTYPPLIHITQRGWHNPKLSPCHSHTQVLSHLYNKENVLQVPISTRKKNFSYAVVQKNLDAAGIAASTFADKISPHMSTESSTQAACVIALCWQFLRWYSCCYEWINRKKWLNDDGIGNSKHLNKKNCCSASLYTTSSTLFGLEISPVFRCARLHELYNRRLSYDIHIKLNFGSIISLNSCMGRGEQRGCYLWKT